MKILVTGYDLEQGEHRGIAVFSKNLLKALHELGHEVWLLTEIAPKHRKLDRQIHGTEAIKLIQCSEIISRLAVYGAADRISSKFSALPIANIIHRILTAVRIRIRVLFNLTAREDQIKLYPCQYIADSPFLNETRTRYLRLVDGIVSIRDVFLYSNSAAQRGVTRPFQILTSDFDLLIKTAPYLITLGKNGDRTIEVVHDVIPMLQHPAGRNTIEYTSCLSIKERKLYISNHARSLYKTYFPNLESTGSQVIVQPPSISDVAVINRYLVTPATTRKKRHSGKGKVYLRIQAFKYILYNSAIEERKNVELVIRAFNASQLESADYKLLIMGRLNNSNYCNNMLQLASPSVIFTDFVGDEVRDQAFLLAACIVTASTAEGFGIPVLDGACMGVNTLASNIASHREISKLYDFSSFISIVHGFRVEDWAQALTESCDLMQQSNTSAEIDIPILENRSRRFSTMRSKVWNDFCYGLKTCIQQDGVGHNV